MNAPPPQIFINNLYNQTSPAPEHGHALHVSQLNLPRRGVTSAPQSGSHVTMPSIPFRRGQNIRKSMELLLNLQVCFHNDMVIHFSNVFVFLFRKLCFVENTRVSHIAYCYCEILSRQPWFQDFESRAMMVKNANKRLIARKRRTVKGTKLMRMMKKKMKQDELIKSENPYRYPYGRKALLLKASV